jgi:hypothetical protein
MSSILPLPEVLEAVGGELGVAGGVLDVAVSEPFLDRPGVVPAMGEREAAAMAQDVRVDGEGEPCPRRALGPFGIASSSAIDPKKSLGGSCGALIL